MKMKITAEPIRLTTFLKQAIGYNKAPINDTCLIKFIPTQAEIAFCLQSDVLIFANYNKNYFINLEAQEEQFMASASLIKDRLAYGFKGEKIMLQTDAENVIITGEGNDDVASQKLEAVNEEKVAPFKCAMSDIGLLPAKMVQPFNLQALISVESFNDLPPLEYVQFDFDGKELKINLADPLGKRSRKIPIKSYAKDNIPIKEAYGTPVKVSFQTKILQQLIGMFEGDVWISLTNGNISISNKTKDYALTYIVGALNED